MKYLIVFGGMLIGVHALGQQATRLSQYFFNPIMVNTAAAGMHQNWMLSAGLKSMWSSVEGAPKTQFINADGTILDNKVGIGFILENDEAGLLGQKKIIANGNYRIRLSRKNWLAIGGGIGLFQNTFDGTKSTFQDINDKSIPNVYMSQLAPYTTAGIYFFNKKTTFGISNENLFRYKIDYTDLKRPVKGKSTRRFNFMVSHRIPINKNLTFVPNILFKFEPFNPTQMDLTPMLDIKNQLKIGIGYRHLESISIIVQNYFTDNFSVGYSYDLQTNGLSSVTSGSHEIVLRYLILKNKSIYVNPRNF